MDETRRRFKPSTFSKACNNWKKFSPVLAPKSPVFTPVSTISFMPLATISSACLTTFAMVSLRLAPRAKGMVQNEQK